MHLSCVDQRHVGKSSHVTMAAQSDAENRLHIRFIETRKSSTGIGRLHLRHGHVPEMSKREQQINNKRRRRFLSHQKGNKHIKLLG